MNHTPSFSFVSDAQSPNQYFGVSSFDPLMQDLNHQHFPASSMPTSSFPSSNNYFDVSTPAQLMNEIHSSQPRTLTNFLEAGPNDPNESILDLTLDTVADLTHLNMVNDALNIGKKLQEGVDAIQLSEKPKMEAVACQTAKVATELAYEAVGTATIVGGIPLLIAESVAFPPLVAAIPLAAAALPEAYANMQQLSKFAGEKAEEDCHLLFSGQ